jgi:hypothetical protein
MPTSATNTIAEHNRPIDRTPLTTRGVAPKRSFIGSPSDGFRRLPPPAERVAAPLSKHSQPRAHGSGSTGWDVNPSLCLSTTIARRGSDEPNPIDSDTSCREHASTQAWRYLRR